MRLDELADQVRDAMPMEAQRWNRNMNLISGKPRWIMRAGLLICERMLFVTMFIGGCEYQLPPRQFFQTTDSTPQLAPHTNTASEWYTDANTHSHTAG